MIGDGALDRPEMRQIKVRGVERSNLRNRFMPRFDMELGRNKRWDGRPITQADTSDIASEDIIVPMINMMMACVPRSRDCLHFKRRHADNVSILKDSDVLFRDGSNPAPEFFHIGAEDASGRLD